MKYVTHDQRKALWVCLGLIRKTCARNCNDNEQNGSGQKAKDYCSCLAEEHNERYLKDSEIRDYTYPNC